MRNSGKALLGLVLQYKGTKINNRFPCSLPEGGQAVPLIGVRVEAGPGVRLEEWLGKFTHPLGGAVCRVHVQYPAFAPTPQKWQLGFWSFCILLFIMPQQCMQAVIFNPL